MNEAIRVPEVGESITEGVLVEWHQEEGALVAVDDPLFELETDKITLTVAAEVAGTLSIGVVAEAEVTVGQVVGQIDTAAARPGAPESEDPAVAAPAQVGTAVDLSRQDLSPAVRRLVAEHGLDPREIPGTGKGGRILKEDVLGVLKRGEEAVPRGDPDPAPRKDPHPAAGERETRRPMSSLRKRLAQRLVDVQQHTAMLTTFNEADMSRVMALRARYKGLFEEKHGVRLGFMSFFVKAAVDALKAVPMVNSRIDGTDIVQQHFYDVGVAVSTERGLVVPVIRDADQLSFAGVEAAIADFAARARGGKLTLGDLRGGTFTLSNGGVYGSLLSTPILNPPQSAILGMHGIKKRPMVMEDDRIEARPMMYLAVSYDHRVVDGAEAVTFLRRIVACIEAPERILFEV